MLGDRGGNPFTMCVCIYMYTLKVLKFHSLFIPQPEIKLPTSAGSWKKQENSRKTSTSALLTMPKPLTVWITINCGKF